MSQPLRKKDPEKVAKIKVEIRDSCSRNAFSKVWYDCNCMADSYETMANKDIKKDFSDYLDANYFNWHTSKQPTVCLNEAAIKKDKFSWCMSYMGSFDSENPKKDAVCHCTANEVLALFKAKPDYSGLSLSDITSEAQFSCRKKIN